MNWYKKAQQENNEWKWDRFLKTFGTTVVLGLAAILGISKMDLKNQYIQNPATIEQKAVEVQNYLTEQQNSPENETFDYEFTKQIIERHEGKESTRYLDSRGIPTIGIGFNLMRPDAKNKIKAFKLNYNDILEGRVSLTDEQIDSLFEDSLKEAIDDARSLVPNFSEHPAKVQTVLIDMAFNLGYNGLSGFGKFRKALLEKNYQAALREMIDSDWYNQVGNRSKELVNMMIDF